MLEVAPVDLATLTAEIVSAYVSYNVVQPGELTGLISAVYAALSAAPKLSQTAITGDLPLPAVPIENSITPDAIICLEDGKSFKSMRRHLQVSYNLTPADYRKRWGLPADYPMVAPNYSATRSVLAKNVGLGQRDKAPVRVPAKRGRPKKVRAGA